MKIDVRALRRAMAAKGYNMASLAEAAGISTTALNGWLNHGRNIRIDTLGKLAKALEVDIYDIAKED